MDLSKDPERAGVREIGDIRVGYFVYHLRFSAKPKPTPTVRRPRHLIAFSVEDSGDIIVARVFHERQMLARHLSEGDEC